MSSISGSSLYNKTSADYQLRQIAQASANVFSQGIIQISDQQSRDKDYEKGLEWIRNYIASLQAKLNTLIEELNVIYEQMMNELMYKKADTKFTAMLPNKYGTPSVDTCLPDLGFTPYNKEVYNYQYNPLFGSRAMDLDAFNRDEVNQNTIGRTYYDISNQHHELGNSFFSTLGYLWMWDVDRINATYATTMDRYVKDGKLYVSRYDPLMDQSEPDDENTDGDNIYYDNKLDIISSQSQGTNPTKYQVNITALQPNRGVFAPGIETQPDEDSFELFEGFENSGVLKSLNLYNYATNSYASYDDCKWTQVFINPYDKDQGKMSEHLQWRIVNNRFKSGTGSIFFGDPTGTNYNYEYYIIKDHAENVLPNGQPLNTINGPAFGDDYIDSLNGNSGNQYNSTKTNLFDTYGIPKNYPDGSQPTVNLGHFPTNATDGSPNKLTIVNDVGVSNNSSTYFSQVGGDTNIHIPNSQTSSIQTDRWSGYYIRDTRDPSGQYSSKWRIVQEGQPGGEAFSGNFSYYFGNVEGNYGAANNLEAVPNDQAVRLHWSGQGDSNSDSWFDLFDVPTFRLTVNGANNIFYQNKGTGGDSGWRALTQQGNNYLKVQFTDVDIDALRWAGSVFFDYYVQLGYRRAALNGTDGLASSQRDVQEHEVTLHFDYGADINGGGDPDHEIWGHGFISSDGRFVIGEYPDTSTILGIFDVTPDRFRGVDLDWSGSTGYTHTDLNTYPGGANYTGGIDQNPLAYYPGLEIETFQPYRPEGFMARKVDLTGMSGPDNLGLGFERLEFRYRQNFETEWIDSDNTTGRYDKRLALEYRNGGYNELAVQPAEYSGVTYSSQRADLRDTSGGWEQVYYQLTNSDFGTTNKQVALFFDAVDQFQNKRRGWNVDDIEVVARGNSKGELISPKINLSQYQNAVLEFDSRFGTHTRNKTGPDPQADFQDKISAYYSVDGGQTWLLLAGSNKSGSEYNGATPINADFSHNQKDNDIDRNNAPDINGDGFPDETTVADQGWTTVKYDLSCVAGSDNVRVKFVFEADADNNEGSGWNIDNVKVYGKKNASTDFYAYKDTIDGNFVTDPYRRTGGSSFNFSTYYINKNQDFSTVTTTLPPFPLSLNYEILFQGGSYNQLTKEQYEVLKHINTYGPGGIAGTLTSELNNWTQQTNNFGETRNTNRPNISFDPRGTNIRGRFNEGNTSRIEITNTDFPMFSNTLLTYVEQDAATYNSNKVDSYATWGAPNTPAPVAVLDSSVPGGLRIETTKNTQFYKDSMGRLINSDNQMYIDRAMAINLGLVQDTVPTAKQVDNKLTGWVNYDTSVDGLPYVPGTCFDEGTAVPGGSGTYEFMTTFVKKTVGLTAAQASGPKQITINVATDAYLYINGEQIGGVSNQNGTTTYNIPAGRLKAGFNTIMLQHNYHLGPDGINITSSNIAGIGALDETWAVRMYEGGFKGRDESTLRSYALGQDPQTGQYTQQLFDNEKVEYFGQEQEELKSMVLNFKNTDGKGVGILSTINEIEIVATGEPTIQSFETKEFTTSTINNNGPLNAVLNYGYIDGKMVIGDDPRAFNIAYKNHLNFSTDTDGFASITLSAKGGNSMVNDATILIKVHYFDDEDQDGVIDIDSDRDGFLSDTEISNGIALGKRKTKYIGSEDRRDTSYYTSTTVGYSGTTANSLATGVYNRFAVVNSGGSNVSYTSLGNKFLKTDRNDDYAFNVYNNLVTASKGRSGGANVDGNVNKLTEKIKAIIDSQEYQEVLKYGLLDNIIIAATTNSSRGDQIVGKIILDWDWRRRRVKVTQGAFSAVYKS